MQNSIVDHVLSCRMLSKFALVIALFCYGGISFGQGVTVNTNTSPGTSPVNTAFTVNTSLTLDSSSPDGWDFWVRFRFYDNNNNLLYTKVYNVNIPGMGEVTPTYATDFTPTATGAVKIKLDIGNGTVVGEGLQETAADITTTVIP
ncbi:MAG: hypothetical protein ABL921_07220 [Pirellula sp.]